MSTKLAIFISHSSHDASLVGLLIPLLRSALNLAAPEIRCTSIDGYRLPGGADTNAQLRLEVTEATVLLGIVSSASVSSHYVMFELGARWGTGKIFVPVLAPGVPSSLLGGPLAGINALRLDKEAQIHQLIEDIGRYLNRRIENPGVYKPQLDSLVVYAKQVVDLEHSDVTQATGARTSDVAKKGGIPGAQGSANDTPGVIDFSEEERVLLTEASDDPSGGVLKTTHIGGLVRIRANGKDLVAQTDPRSVAKWEAGLKRLCALGLMEESGTGGKVFTLTDSGFVAADAIKGARPS